MWEVAGSSENKATQCEGLWEAQMVEHGPLPKEGLGSIPTAGTCQGNEGGAVKASPGESGVPECGRWGLRGRGCEAEEEPG